MVQRGLEQLRRTPAADPLEPAWGEAELHMLLAFFQSDPPATDLAAAERHAREALRLQPHWRYVRKILLPRIEQAAASHRPAHQR